MVTGEGRDELRQGNPHFRQGSKSIVRPRQSHRYRWALVDMWWAREAHSSAAAGVKHADSPGPLRLLVLGPRTLLTPDQPGWLAGGSRAAFSVRAEVSSEMWGCAASD
jgi:hypothetical protein